MNHLFDLLEKIVAAENGEVAVAVPEEKFNLLMLRILRAKAKAENRSIHFQAEGPRGRALIAALSGDSRSGKESRREGTAAPAKAAKKARLSPRWRRIGIIVAIFLGALILIGGLAYGAFYYLPKAEVILTLNPIPLVKEISVTVDTAVSEVTAEEGIIPGTLQTVEENGSKSTPATGTATVGEKAKGAAAFTSTVNQSCSAGARIKENSGGLIFTLDSAVSFTGAPEQKDFNLTAEKIGTGYNLAAGKSFSVVSGCSVGGLSIAGTNSDPFTGGSSQQVTIASSTDHAKLLKELEEELVESAKESIRAEAGIDEVVVDQALKTEVVEKNYSHAVGEQAENVTLNLKIKLTTITYRGSEIQELVSKSLGALIPAGFTLFPGETEIEPLDPKLAAAKLTFQAKISAKVVPEVDQEKIKADLAGRNSESAVTYLDSLGDVNAYELKIWPNLPGSLQRIPRSTGRITITLVTEE